MATISDQIERPNAVTFRGSPMTLVGKELAAGDSAPAFTLTGAGLAPVTLKDAIANNTRAALLIVVPSLDTPTCSAETVTFQKRAAELPAGLAVYVVSADLPFAQARWADANGAESFAYLSSYRDPAFGTDYGVTIKELGLLARSLFVIDKNGKIGYAHIVPEVAQEPDYDAAIAATHAI
jgi:thiol peroxidase